jgi:hypothetical protein
MVKKLMVVVCTHTGQVFAECAASCIGAISFLNRAGISVSFRTVLFEAYVPRAKSKAADKLLESDCDGLILVDYDLGFDETAFARLILPEKWIVSGAFPYKTGEGYPVIVDDPDTPVDGLIPAVSVTSGFTFIHRYVFETMLEKIDIRESEGVRFFFDTGFLFDDDPRWYGEDRTFCRMADDMGIPMWIEPNIRFVHMGVSKKTGCYAEQ